MPEFYPNIYQFQLNSFESCTFLFWFKCPFEFNLIKILIVVVHVAVCAGSAFLDLHLIPSLANCMGDFFFHFRKIIEKNSHVTWQKKSNN